MDGAAGRTTEWIRGGATTGALRGHARTQALRGGATTQALALIAALAAAALLAGALAWAQDAAAAGGSQHRGRVTGIVVYGPMLPVSRGSSVSWPAQQADVRVYKGDATTPLQTLRSGVDGRFTVKLAPGRYRLRPEPIGVSTLPIPHDTFVRVRAGKTTPARLWLDSGVEFPDAKDAGQTVAPADPPAGRHKYAQGVVGTTRRGPIVPTVRPGEPSDEPCDATLVFYRPDGKVVARVKSSKQAGFVTSLPAGTFIVDGHSAVSSFDRGGPFTLTVPREQWLSLTVWFDTGIRFAGLRPSGR